jgi:natural resistance-associated macrophage protein
MSSVTTDTHREENVATRDPTGCDSVPVTIDYSEQSSASSFSMKRLMKFAGPGLLMSIAYVDPGNLESDLQTGTRTGYTLGWLVLWSTVLGFLVQLLAMRLGVVTTKHLAQHCRDVYPVMPRIVLWLMTEIAIIGSDIQEVIGSAIAIRLLSNSTVPLWAGVLITGVDTFFLLFLERLGARKLEAFFGVLVATMTASFGVMYAKAKCPTGQVLLGVLLPRISSKDIDIAAGVVGSLVMPHNIFLHSALVQSRKIDTSSKLAKREAILYNAIESGVSLGITVVINLFVVAVFAVRFHSSAAVDVGLSSAGTYLGERFGDVTKIIWAIGLLAAGQSSTMTGTYTGQFVMSGFMDLKVCLLFDSHDRFHRGLSSLWEFVKLHV